MLPGPAVKPWLLENVATARLTSPSFPLSTISFALRNIGQRLKFCPRWSFTPQSRQARSTAFASETLSAMGFSR